MAILKAVCGPTHIFWQDALSPTTARVIQKQWHWRVSVSPVKVEERCSADHRESMERIHSPAAAVLDKVSLTVEETLQNPSIRESPLKMYASKNIYARSEIVPAISKSSFNSCTLIITLYAIYVRWLFVSDRNGLRSPLGQMF